MLNSLTLINGYPGVKNMFFTPDRKAIDTKTYATIKKDYGTITLRLECKYKRSKCFGK